MVSKNKGFKKYQISMLFALLLTIPLFGVQSIGSSSDIASDIARDVKTSDDWSRSNISVPAVQNLTFSPSNSSVVESPPYMNPTMLKIDVARRFEPEQRFNSEFNATLWRSNVANSTFKETNSGVSVFFNTTKYPSYAAYNLSFASPLNVSQTDFVSFAFWTSSSFNSSQALIGVSLKLRDEQGNRHYVSVVVSDQHSADNFGLSEWFLGTGFTSELPKYPYYSMKYGSLSGSWFKQLSLSESLTVLNLSSAWLDGLLVGGEAGYIGAPLGPYSMTELDARFYFTLVHHQLFLINQQNVNSTVMAFPYQTRESLSFSGIPYRSVSVAIEGFLKPSSEKEEPLDNGTASSREVFFDLSEAAESGVVVNGEVNITVFSKDVKKCLLTLNNDTVVDLTDALLFSKTEVYIFPRSTSTLKVLLVFYKFNAWIFSFQYLDVRKITKSGIVEEHFSTGESEGSVDVNSTLEENKYLAIRTAWLTPSAITFDGVEKPLESMLVLDEEVFFIIPLVNSGENSSLYTIKYQLSDSPLYESFTVTPFELHFQGSVFRIFTPFNVEGELGFYIPITVQMITYRTFVLQVEYDSSYFEVDQKEIMAYSNRIHYEYFALKPLQAGQNTVSLKITDTVDQKALFSTLFSVKISGSFFSQTLLYFTFSITVLSIVAIFEGKKLAKWILHR